MKKLNKFFSILKVNQFWVDEKLICDKLTIASLVLSVSALFMLIMNVRNNSKTLAFLSAVLIIGFLFSAFSAKLFKDYKLSAHIISVLVCVVLSAFAINAGNQGFAILWVLLVPIFAVNLVGTKDGIIVSTYFLLFILLLFYSPLDVLVDGKYTDAFASRFPILFACDYVISLFISLQGEYYNRRMHMQSYIDELTGAFNRRYFMNCMEKSKDSVSGDIGILVMDLNGLKKVNDTKGHHAGDEIIAAVVDISKKLLGKDSVIARMGGDEFAALLEINDDQAKIVMDQLKKDADRWKGVLNENMSVSFGWASKNSEGISDLEELYKIADKKMYDMKASFYSQDKFDRRQR